MKHCRVNVLEHSSVGLTAGAEDASHPLWRLYDRDVQRLFRASQAETLEVRIDQGSQVEAVQALFIPSGHNLEGQALSLSYSSDDATYTVADTWTGSSGLMARELSEPITARYWRFKVDAPPVVPELAELFLGPLYAWARLPARPGGPFEQLLNVEVLQSASGRERFLVHGPARAQRRYSLQFMEQAQKEELLLLWQQGLPFWLKEHAGTWLWGRLRSALELQEVAAGRWTAEFDFIEVL